MALHVVLFPFCFFTSQRGVQFSTPSPSLLLGGERASDIWPHPKTPLERLAGDERTVSVAESTLLEGGPRPLVLRFAFVLVLRHVRASSVGRPEISRNFLGVCIKNWQSNPVGPLRIPNFSGSLARVLHQRNMCGIPEPM